MSYIRSLHEGLDDGLSNTRFQCCRLCKDRCAPQGTGGKLVTSSDETTFMLLEVIGREDVNDKSNGVSFAEADTDVGMSLHLETYRLCFISLCISLFRPLTLEWLWSQ